MEKKKIYKIIQKLKNEGYTIICITNLADEILLADRTIILNNGKIVEQIEKSELIEKSKVFEKYEIKVPTLLELLIKLKNNGIKLDTNKNLTIDSFVEELIIKLKSRRIYSKMEILKFFIFIIMVTAIFFYHNLKFYLE